MEPIKTNQGLGQGMPLTDIQEYNKTLKENTSAIEKQTKEIKMGFLIGYILLIGIFAFCLWFAMHFNLVDYVAFKIGMGC